MPINTTLRVKPGRDSLSLAYNTVFADLEMPEPSRQQVAFRFAVTGHRRWVGGFASKISGSCSRRQNSHVPGTRLARVSPGGPSR